MSRCSFILAVSLLCMSLLCEEAAAEERLLRVQRLDTGSGFLLRYPPNLEYRRDQESAIFDAHTFTVYTVAEVDSIAASLTASVNAQGAAAIAELRGLVDSLRKNIQDLSDVNDALARRVEELEKRQQVDNQVSTITTSKGAAK